MGSPGTGSICRCANPRLPALPRRAECRVAAQGRRRECRWQSDRVAGNTRTWTEAHVRRLFWRAGFGRDPARGVPLGPRRPRARDRALRARPAPRRAAAGARPTVKGRPLDPRQRVRPRQSSGGWTGWSARRGRWRRSSRSSGTTTSPRATRTRRSCCARTTCCGSTRSGAFRKLLGEVTRDPAMQLFLSLADSHKESPNENYARELMELFTLGERLHRARHPRGGPRADRLAGLAQRRAGCSGIWFDRGAPRRGRQAHLRPARALRNAGRARHRRRPPAPRAVPDREAVGLLHHRADRPPDQARPRPDLPALGPARSSLSSSASCATRALYARLDAPDMVKSPARLPGRASSARRASRSPATTTTWLLGEDGPGAVPAAERRRLGLGRGVADERHDQGPPGRRQPHGRLGRARRLAVPHGAADPTCPPPSRSTSRSPPSGDPWVSGATRSILTNVAARLLRRPDPALAPGRGEGARADMLQRTLRNLLLSGPDAHLH